MKEVDGLDLAVVVEMIPHQSNGPTISSITSHRKKTTGTAETMIVTAVPSSEEEDEEQHSKVVVIMMIIALHLRNGSRRQVEWPL